MEVSRKSPSILIAGGGIGGLTAALALAKAGVPVRIAERGDGFEQSGAGIQITPNAGRILAELGLDDEIAARASEPEAIEIRSWRGARLARVKLGARFRRRYGVPYRTIHRADLQGVLASAAASHPLIELMPQRALVEFALHPHGITAMLEGESGHREIAIDALISAEGIGSMVRSYLPGGSDRRPTGKTAWRTVIAASDAPEGMALDRIGLWLGKDIHVVHYPVRSGEEVNVVVTARDPKRASAGFPDVGKKIARWAAPIAALANLTGWKAWPISEVRPGGRWTSGPVALLGDAAHAMVPYVAQGGAMAIEDAAVLARFVADDPGNIEAAFAAYESTRHRRVRRVWRAARGAAELYHMGALTGAVRNIGLLLAGGLVIGTRYGWIYAWRPPETQSRRPKAARPVEADPAVS